MNSTSVFFLCLAVVIVSAMYLDTQREIARNKCHKEGDKVEVHVDATTLDQVVTNSDGSYTVISKDGTRRFCFKEADKKLKCLLIER